MFSAVKLTPFDLPSRSHTSFCHAGAEVDLFRNATRCEASADIDPERLRLPDDLCLRGRIIG